MSIVKIDPVKAAPTADMLSAELNRRLSLGFAYTFSDVRGMHHFGTTPADMDRWINEVTPLAQAFINSGNPEGIIGIKTDTGPVAVTAAEWQQILLAAAAYRQPIYQAYFAIKAMELIPTDYASNGAYWPLNSES